MEKQPVTIEHLDHHDTLGVPDSELILGDGQVLAQVQPSDQKAHPGLRLADDGHTVLLPQPSNDPNDPLNWSSFKKHSILLALCVGSFASDASGIVTPAVVLQAVEWGMSPNDVNQSTNLNVLMVGLGGLVCVPLLESWGRAPILFWSAVLGFAAVLGGALSQSFTTWYAFRALAGLFYSSYIGTGLCLINDMFFFHEHARKIGIWITAVLLAPFLGSAFGNFIIYGLGKWRPTAWVFLAMQAVNLLVTPAFVDETYYNRRLSESEQPPRGSRPLRLLGIWQLRHHSYFPAFFPSVMKTIKVFIHPLVLMSVVYFFMAYMWFIGTCITAPILLQTPPAIGGYGFSNMAVGFIQFAPLIGIVIGETFGHFFNDWLATRFTRKHNGAYAPRARLPANVLAVIPMIPGLILLGFTLQKHLHWSGVVFGWAMYTCGACITSVALYAFLADHFPTATAECSAILNLTRCLGGYGVGYFELSWGLTEGYDVSFGIKAAIVAASLFWIVIFNFYGHRIRHLGFAV